MDRWPINHPAARGLARILRVRMILAGVRSRELVYIDLRYWGILPMTHSLTLDG